MAFKIKNIIRPPTKIGQILIKNKVLTNEDLNAALLIQKREKSRFAKNIAVLVCILAIPSAFFVFNLNKPNDIIIRDAKIVTGVNKEMVPLKVTNFFPKNTTKVCAWVSWANAKINSRILIKWYYITDDVPIYDYKLNIPKKEGIANVVLAMPQGKTLPSGTYKVVISSGKKPLLKPLTFEIE